jgi:hypothetical protein
MGLFTWLGGSLSAASSWSQPDPDNPVEPGANDSVTIAGSGALSGSVSPATATLSGQLDLQGDIAAASAIGLNDVTLTIESGSSLSSANSIDMTNASVTQSGGSLSAAVMMLDSGAYALASGLLTVGAGGEFIGDAAGQTASFTQTGGANIVAGKGALDIGSGPGSHGNYMMSAGALKTAFEIVGDQGTGSFTQSGASSIRIAGAKKAKLDIGAQSGGSGSFSLNGGGLRAPLEIVGDAGTGGMTQAGGYNWISGGSGTLDLGAQYSGNGAYTLTGGRLHAPIVVIGDSGTGAFVQNGGANIIAGAGAELDIGRQSSSHGSYELNLGGLDAVSIIVGDYGTGGFTQSGASRTTVAGPDAKLDIGVQSGGSGSFALNGGTLSAPLEIVGDAGTGGMTQAGGDNQISGGSGMLDLGAQPSGNGVYTFTGGRLNAPIEVIGDQGTGAFVQNGGVNTIGGAGAKLDIGRSGYHGSRYELDLGALNTVSEIVGDYGSGTFTQKGGANRISGALTLGASFFQSGGLYELDSGALDAGSEIDGNYGYGAFTQNGGTNRISGALILAAQYHSQGYYTLAGGTLSAASETLGGPASGAGFTQSGGVNMVHGVLTIANGSYTLTGGSLTAKGVVASNLTVANASLSTPMLSIGESMFVNSGGVVRIARGVAVAGGKLVLSGGSVAIGNVANPLAKVITIGAKGALTGQGIIYSAVTESAKGVVEAESGVLSIVGAVGGGGTLLIADGATLDLGGKDTNTIAFMGGAGTLKLEKKASVSGRITQLQAGDVIVFAHEWITGVRREGASLTVTEKSGATVVLQVSGKIQGLKFVVANFPDGREESTITLEAPPAATANQDLLFRQYVAAGFQPLATAGFDGPNLVDQAARFEPVLAPHHG